jgi:sortase A
MSARMTKRTRGAVLLAAFTVAGVGLSFAAGLHSFANTEPNANGHAGARRPAAALAGAYATSGAPSADPPRDEDMILDVPALRRLSNVPVTTARGTAEAPLHDGALHIAGTGFPWQKGANVYIAGHRVGFPGTRSSLLFWDLDELQAGDMVVLHDSEDRRYKYRVFARRTVAPDDISVTDPVPGKSVVSLQTCTLPDYARRLVVQAELVSAPPDTAAGAPLAHAGSPTRTHGRPR